MEHTSLLRLPEVKARTGLSRTKIYLLEAQGRFPRRVALGARSVGWSSDEIQDWVEARIRESRGERS